ncbi:tRNA (adenosine(37)-N6)-dimethylallyltransferase MiaA [Treponema zioleckii]|uniref:tRNA (adenosine(37)-N6)-dimethylallyltransferase MiaA n=1 Tax=Treponema zioleckii TaxID=331680 RepID=UPI00168BC04B|nr:tRNA (adenosine(37)-N6)-dimethylallyltransferase MiaA [Treponema zioleckii]
MSYNSIFVIGPTAVGKTAIGVQLASRLNGEIISADSRQVYKGLDIGSGKDLADYDLPTGHIPYHLIDVCTLQKEYNLFDFQEGFYDAFEDIQKRGKLPLCVGGTGMYVDSIVSNYNMIPTPENPEMYAELSAKSYDELKEILIREKEKLHNTTEFGDKERIIKAIMINRFNTSEECKKIRESLVRPKVEPVIFGTTLERSLVREKIARRLRERLDHGLIEEVEGLHANGAEWERLESLGLEYRFVSQYLQGKIESKEKLFELLNLAIGQFAKRQETWFRFMEKKGVKINWLPREEDVNARVEAALAILNSLGFRKKSKS